MKLIRFGNIGEEKPGIQLDNGSRKDVSALAKIIMKIFSELMELKG